EYCKTRINKHACINRRTYPSRSTSRSVLKNCYSPLRHPRLTESILPG
ncbi:hypothetical protein LINPERHAP1_LOCUS14973, partial [Linum perenne]